MADAPADAFEPDDHVAMVGVAKTFTIHAQSSRIPVLRGAGFRVKGGERVALAGPSGAGKSSLLRLIYGNYRCQSGAVYVRRKGPRRDEMIDVAVADPHEILELRRDSLGYVSQFLRVIPRVSALDVVAEPAMAVGAPEEEARDRAAALLRRLNVREALWPLSPLTFSGGEQQRVNIARGFSHAYATLLLDEPTASLDPENREIVMALMAEARDRGAALIGIFHDPETRARFADREVDVGAFAAAA